MAAPIQPLGLSSNTCLPGGSCNYRELSRGTKSPICGCKRFWLNVANPVSQSGTVDNVWCFCGHHACFHESGNQQGQSSLTTLGPTEQPRRTPEGYVAVQHAGAISQGLGIRPDSRSQSQSINARIWNALNGFARAQEGQDDDGMRLPSTVASFNGELLAAPRPMDPPLQIPGIIVADDFPGSATEVATPSVAATPDLRHFVPPGSQTRPSPVRPEATLQPVVEEQAPSDHTTREPSPARGAISPRRMPQEEILNLLQAHGARLAALESLSFAQIPVEEVQDKFELFDSRLLDLEHWRGDVDDKAKHEAEEAAARQALPKSRKRRFLPAETGSFASDESFDLSAAAHAEAAVLATIATNAEIAPRIDQLESRMADIERAAAPTHARPWEVEIVMLPWGRNLRGIWFSADDATQHSIRSSQTQLDEWAGVQSQLKSSFRSSSSHGAWTTESIQAWAEDAQDWLSPKACGPASTVFQRLASRGFIRRVLLKSGDARHVTDAIASAFKDVLKDCSVEDPAQTQFNALTEAIIPLRKVRKSSRLRFLTPAEMVTPAIWTAQFLDLSVFMKVGEGQRRLYVTSPHAYLQGSYDGASWPAIRKLTARDANGEVQCGQVDPSIAIEACWSYNDKLDFVPSLHASFQSHISRQSVWSTKSQESVNQPELLTPAISTKAPQLGHQRSNSLPGSASGAESAHEASKRRVASFENATSTVPIIAPPQEQVKRRKLSVSHEAERRGVNFTPRMSREPPSPFYSEHAAEARSQAASRKRGMTPVAYATPFSNNFLHDRPEIPGDGDTEHDSVDLNDRQKDEEWQGMDGAEDKIDEQADEDVISSFDSDELSELSEEDEDMNE